MSAPQLLLLLLQVESDPRTGGPVPSEPSTVRVFWWRRYLAAATSCEAPLKPLPSDTIDLIDRVLVVLKAGNCRAALVGGCAVALRAGVATRPIRDVDIYCPEQKKSISLLAAAGLLQVGHSKLRWGKTIVDIVHPDLPRISKVNRLFLDRCLVSQQPLPVRSDGTVTTLCCPTTPALLALKLYSATHRTMWLTRRHDLRDALTLIAHAR